MVAFDSLSACQYELLLDLVEARVDNGRKPKENEKSYAIERFNQVANFSFKTELLPSCVFDECIFGLNVKNTKLL